MLLLGRMVAVRYSWSMEFDASTDLFSPSVAIKALAGERSTVQDQATGAVKAQTRLTRHSALSGASDICSLSNQRPPFSRQIRA